MEDIKDNYADIINLKHHKSKIHRPMPIESRAAQFAPFAALTGYNDVVKEKSRLTDKKIEMDDEAKLIINSKLQTINKNIKNKPKVSITYFVPDNKKSGGTYLTIQDNVKRIDSVYKYIYLLNNKINIEDIINIEIL